MSGARAADCLAIAIGPMLRDGRETAALAQGVDRHVALGGSPLSMAPRSERKKGGDHESIIHCTLDLSPDVRCE